MAPFDREPQTVARELPARLSPAGFCPFGHEHRCTIYDDSGQNPAALFPARLIGNDSIPHHPQEEVTAEAIGVATTNPFLKVNSGSIDEEGQVAICTFALLTFNGPNLHIDYINEDDTIFYAEDWNAKDKLW